MLPRILCYNIEIAAKGAGGAEGVRGKTRDKVKRGIYQAGKALTKPGAFLHEKAEDAMYSSAIEVFLYAVAVVLVTIGALTMIFSPRGPMHPAMVIFLSLILLFALILLIGFIVPLVLYVLCAVTAPFAYIHERCARKLSGGGSGGGETYRPGPDGGGSGDGRARRPDPEERPKTELEQAEKLFGVTAPYTRDEVRDARNRLLKKHHPDVGGSEEMTKRINAAYELLVEHAT